MMTFRIKGQVILRIMQSEAMALPEEVFWFQSPVKFDRNTTD